MGSVDNSLDPPICKNQEFRNLQGPTPLTEAAQDRYFMSLIIHESFIIGETVVAGFGNRKFINAHPPTSVRASLRLSTVRIISHVGTTRESGTAGQERASRNRRLLIISGMTTTFTFQPLRLALPVIDGIGIPCWCYRTPVFHVTNPEVPAVQPSKDSHHVMNTHVVQEEPKRQ